MASSIIPRSVAASVMSLPILVDDMLAALEGALAAAKTASACAGSES